VRLQLDLFSGRQVLTHNLTCERLTLPAGEWSLHAMDGFACLVNSGMTDENEQGAWATDFFSSSMFVKKATTGPVMLLADGSQGDVKPTALKMWSDATSEFHWKGISWQCRGVKANISHFAGYYIIPRAGARWWWRLQDLHSNLRLAACQNKRAPHSRWVARRIGPWETWLASVLRVSGALARGISKGASDNSANPADWACCSTHGLLAILARLAGLDRAKGGLSTADGRRAAWTYLDTLLDAAAGSPWSLQVFGAAQSLEWTPPMLLEGALPVVLPVNSQGWVDVGDCWKSAATPLQKALALAIDQNPSDAQLHEGFVSLPQLFRICMGSHNQLGMKSPLNGFLQQLCIRLGDRIEAILHARLGAGRGAGQAPILHGVQLGIGADSPDELDKQKASAAFAYWKAAQNAASIHAGLPVSFTLDATNVGRNSIQDCAVLWPSNVAAWLFPQVGLRSRRNIY
jgi:hypothetical protein